MLSLLAPAGALGGVSPVCGFAVLWPACARAVEGATASTTHALSTRIRVWRRSRMVASFPHSSFRSECLLLRWLQRAKFCLRSKHSASGIHDSALWWLKFRISAVTGQHSPFGSARVLVGSSEAVQIRIKNQKLKAAAGGDCQNLAPTRTVGRMLMLLSLVLPYC